MLWNYMYVKNALKPTVIIKISAKREKSLLPLSVFSLSTLCYKKLFSAELLPSWFIAQQLILITSSFSTCNQQFMYVWFPTHLDPKPEKQAGDKLSWQPIDELLLDWLPILFVQTNCRIPSHNFCPFFKFVALNEVSWTAWILVI